MRASAHLQIEIEFMKTHITTVYTWWTNKKYATSKILLNRFENSPIRLYLKIKFECKRSMHQYITSW